MGYSSLQLSAFTLTRQKTEKNRKLMECNDKQTVLATQSNAIRTNDEDWYKNPVYKQLEAEQKQLDIDIKKFDTELEAISENLKAIEEQRDENAKDVPKLT